MFIETISLKNFRNFEENNVNFSKKLNVFLGANGQGKSNLLEALYLTTTGESFRYCDITNLIKSNSEYSYLNTHLKSDEFSNLVHLELVNNKKSFYLNKKKISTNKLKIHFSSIIFSPESLSIIKENSEFRRNLIDELLITFDKNNSNLIHEYKKVLKTKNRIYKDYKENKIDKKTCQDLIESINPSFLKLATLLTYYRLQAISEIKTSLNQAMQSISKNFDKELSIQYTASDRILNEFTKVQVAELLNSRIIELRDAELSSYSCLIGPHKHDIKFLYAGNDSRFFCSQGQQRAIILSFKMAQIVYHRKLHGIYPILMLDDVLSELDIEKRNALIGFLHEINTQIFITTTDFNLQYSFSLDEISVQKFQEGQIISS